MDARAQRYRYAFALFTGLAIFFFQAGGLVSAADQATAPATKKVTKAKPGKTNSSLPLAPAVTEDAALASFDTFTIEWMKKLAQTEDFHRAQAKIAESPEGFVVEYVGYLPERYIIIKKTNSTDTPFVGILTYFEKKLRSTGKTKEEAVQGPFNQVDASQVSEIFRFTKGKWEY